MLSCSDGIYDDDPVRRGGDDATDEGSEGGRGGDHGRGKWGDSRPEVSEFVDHVEGAAFASL